MFLLPKLVEEVESKFNGKIKVFKTWGKYSLSVDNLTQSGGLVELIWRKGLQQVTSDKLQVTRCLILGLGGGTAAKIVHEYWPKAKIIGVEIDPVMVELARKYFTLPKNLKIIIGDALKIVYSLQSTVYSLILVDLYRGKKIIKIDHEQIKKLCRGVIIYNFLGHKIEGFDSCERHKILSNTLVFCRRKG